ncbi:hypothetical protein QUF61_01375 [Candidatus Venteria ishoeyi]|uniref:hypothetical protein n=1 Tax=Candidatus Venteria ishoeyi TaxID=1899563 RepID=UPI0025A517FC|nr:hypothetical protein [Candidatus Venteria ishoeyi]MDM8545124.1 hypothetical protein [Candidatus Venteria ishoeyi]
MQNDTLLESYSHTIEGALCAYDVQVGNTLKDAQAIHILECLLDIYHFGDTVSNPGDPVVADGVQYVDKAIKADAPDIDIKILVKILAVLRFVAHRRAKNADTSREYMTIIHQYTGVRVGSGMRAIPNI